MSGRWPDHLSTSQMAALCGVSAKTVARWVDQGLLPALYTTGGHRRIPREHALAFLRFRRGLRAEAPAPEGLSLVMWVADPALGARIEAAARGIDPSGAIHRTGDAAAFGLAVGWHVPGVVAVDAAVGYRAAAQALRALAQSPLGPWVRRLVLGDDEALQALADAALAREAPLEDLRRVIAVLR